jgi:hypothetical protein
MRTSSNGGSSWTGDTRITDQSSLVQYDDVTSYLDSSDTGNDAWVIWPDHANQLPCPVGNPLPCPTSPPPIIHADTHNAIDEQQVSVST